MQLQRMKILHHFILLGLLMSGAAPALSDSLLSIQQAQLQLFPGLSQFIAIPVDLDTSQRQDIKKKSGVRFNPKRIQVWQVQQQGVAVGWFFVDQVIGKHEYIRYALAIDDKNQVKGVEILEYLETHGGEVKQQSWRQQFIGKSISDNALKLGKDIDGRSGATLSCRNVTDGIRKLLILHKVMVERITAIKASAAL